MEGLVGTRMGVEDGGQGRDGDGGPDGDGYAVPAVEEEVLRTGNGRRVGWAL